MNSTIQRAHRRAFPMLVASVATLATAQANAQSTPAPDRVPVADAVTAAAGDGRDDGGIATDIVVTGTRDARRNAAAEQHRATIVSTVVSADVLLKMPSTSVADSMKRLPGLSVVADRNTGEGRFVTIRGLDTALNVYTLNGTRLPTSDKDNRGVALDLLPPDGLESVRVVKSVTPDLDGDAVGGTLDFRTPSPFDFAHGLTSGTVRAGHDDLSRTQPVEVVASGARRFGADRSFGIYATAYYTKKTVIGERNENIDYNGSWLSPTYVADGDTVLRPGRQILSSHGLDRFTNRIERLGGNFTAEYRPDANSRFYLRGFYAQFRNTLLHDYLDVKSTTGTDASNRLVQVDPTATGIAAPNASVLSTGANGVRTYRYTPAQIVDRNGDGVITDADRQSDDRSLYSLIGASGTYDPQSFGTLMGAEVKQEDNRLAMIDAGGENRFGALTLTYDGAYSYGRTETPKQYYMEFASNDATAAAFATPVAFSAVDAKYPTWRYTPAQAAAAYSTANLGLVAAELYRRKSTDSQLFGKVDLAYRPADDGILSLAQAGVRVRRSTRTYDQQEQVDISNGPAFGLTDAPLGTTLASLPRLIGGSIDSFQGGRYTGSNRFGTVLNMDAALALLESGPRLTDGNYSWNLNDRSGRETSYSGYGMVTLEKGPFALTTGARYERTAIRNVFSVAIDQDDGTTSYEYGGADGTTAASYGRLLPSIHVNYRPNHALVVRGAVWTSFARPNFTDISNAITIERAGSRIVGISRGNPDLKPADALNLDLGADYLAGNTTLSIGGFYKDIGNFIYKDATQSTSFTDANGVTISQTANGRSAWIAGLELAARRPLRWGFSISGNFTYQKSRADPGIAYRDDVRPSLPNAPDYLGNLTLSYGDDRWDADIGYTYRGKYVAALRANALDEYVQPQNSLDAGVRYRITHGIIAGLLAQNITRAPSYWATRGADTSQTLGYQAGGRIVTLSLTARY